MKCESSQSRVGRQLNYMSHDVQLLLTSYCKGSHPVVPPALFYLNYKQFSHIHIQGQPHSWVNSVHIWRCSLNTSKNICCKKPSHLLLIKQNRIRVITSQIEAPTQLHFDGYTRSEIFKLVQLKVTDLWCARSSRKQQQGSRNCVTISSSHWWEEMYI